MRYGRTCEDGFITIFSVNTEEEARQLLAATCPKNYHGDFIAPELTAEQTLDHLYAFGDRLAETYQQLRESIAPKE